MRRYIEHIKNTRTPHERRTHALQIAGIITAAIFVTWAGTLSWRFANLAPVAQDDGTQTSLSSGQTSLTASAAAAQVQQGAHLEVSTTSVYSN